MPMPQVSFVIAAVQTTPIFLNREATVEKACGFISEAGQHDASLIVFSESFIPAYPDWLEVASTDEAALQTLKAQLLDNAVEIPSPATQRLGQAARQARAHVVIGVSERSFERNGPSLYNTLLYIDAMGNILGKHRQLISADHTGQIQPHDNGQNLVVYNTPFGKIGGLIGRENHLPLARQALYTWGIQIYIAAARQGGEPWLSTLRHIAREGCIFVISCGMILHKDDIPDRFEFKQRFYQSAGDWLSPGDSAIVNPEGNFIAGPLHQEEGILYAEIDPLQVYRPKE